MTTKYRILALTALVLSSATMVGCAALPQAGTSVQGTAMSPEAQTGGLQVTINSAQYQTQAFSNLAIKVLLEMPSATYLPEEKRTRSATLVDGGSYVFDKLPPERANVTVTLVDINNGEQEVARDSQWVQIVPGKVAPVQFQFTIGGTSALDTMVSIDGETGGRDLRQDTLSDGLNEAFQKYQQPISGSIAFVWSKGDLSAPVTFRFNGSYYPYRRIGNGNEEMAMPWWSVPTHAACVDSDPLGAYTQVRHYRWENLYTVNGQEHTYIIDRWLSASEGLLQEEVSERLDTDLVKVSTMKRSGM